LEITISARGHNIPTQVHPQGNARFAVSFIPLEAVGKPAYFSMSNVTAALDDIEVNVEGECFK
jgi:hypothetical protein